jgi:hypothetical protein
MLRVATWAVCSAAAAVVSEIAANALWVALWGRSVPQRGGLSLWPEPAWWTAAAVYGVLLAALAASRRPTVRRFLLACVAAAVVYVVTGSALSTLDFLGTADPDVAGSGWADAVVGVALVRTLLWGNTWVALLAPGLLGFVPVFRRAVVGVPLMWSNRPYTAADDDAAAEDFGIY